MPSLTEHLLADIERQQLLRPGDRVGVAVSGGIDSVALLRLLTELRSQLGIVLSVVHFNHKLRDAESDADERFVADLALRYNLEFTNDSDDVAARAREEGISLETAAHDLRYGFFRHLIASGLDKIATGHTLDDQAETVLMRMIRGSGLRGLGGIHPAIPVEDDEGGPSGEIVRPMLRVRRGELEGYLKDIGQSWREDGTNDDTKFLRNRVRKLVLPLLEKEFNRSLPQNLAELADIARGEEEYWANEASGWMGTGIHWSVPDWAQTEPKPQGLVQISALTPPKPEVKDGTQVGDDLHSRVEKARWLVMNASVDRLWFLGEPVAVQRRAVKAIGEHGGIPLEFKHVEEILRFAAAETRTEISLPLGWKVEQNPEELVFVTPDLRGPIPLSDYEYDLQIPERVSIAELGSTIELRRVPIDAVEGYNPDELLNPNVLPGPLKVRNWRAGDRFWPAHTKSPKKIKEFLQERHVAQPQRRLWPVLVSGSVVLWMRGFPVPDEFRAKPGQDALAVLETPIASESIP